ncbi:hypothetical protein KL909_004142 [Ogataea angusta]|nr:hypothetical protein KL909_004142 [Ogataea angusta]KAG7843680.1 hypothetical protein KL941_004662 [Ogataea angusta]
MTIDNELDFDRLRRLFRQQLDTGTVLETKDVNHKALMHLMARYKSDRDDWARYAFEDKSIAYTRNGVENFGPNGNLLLLVWNPGRGSAIHDHAGAHCVMKILSGELTEELFDGESLEPIKTSMYRADDVAHIEDTIGLHRITNRTDKVAISLHLYTPPYAEVYGCHVFENGKRQHVDMDLYSRDGVLLEGRGVAKKGGSDDV